MVLQIQLWLGILGQIDLVRRFLVLVLVCEIAPVLVNIIILGRSGMAIIAELGAMNSSGQVRALDAQGIDPLTYVVMPRVVGIAISAFCLTSLFLVISLGGGYCFSWFVGHTNVAPLAFANAVLQSMGVRELLAVLLKSLLPGLMTGLICCVQGLSITSISTGIAEALPRAFIRCMVALSVTSVMISFILY